MTHQPGVYVPLGALFLDKSTNSSFNTLSQVFCHKQSFMYLHFMNIVYVLKNCK